MKTKKDLEREEFRVGMGSCERLEQTSQDKRIQKDENVLGQTLCKPAKTRLVMRLTMCDGEEQRIAVIFVVVGPFGS